MKKGYWIAFYRFISDKSKIPEYARLSGAAIEAGGGRFLARSSDVKAYEAGRVERTVLIEFESLEKAIACYEGEGYQAALKVIEGTVERDLRIVEGA
jgi:uncharacterized protein (DUF1330 family)